jgi:hypothetical protein
VCYKEEKKRTKLTFQIERSIRQEKQIQVRKFSQFKSVKT